jgi:electron-transferring-flavoprotein dehydrogenase
VPRIKGSHNAILSGILAAEKVVEALGAGKANDDALITYENEWRSSEIGSDLKKVRNVKPLWSRFGTALGVGIGGIDMWINQLTGGRSLLGTLKHGKTDAESLERAEKHKPIDYPKPDGVLTFDRLSSVYRFT